MKAILLIRRRVVLVPDVFVEVLVWRLLPSVHGFKYRLAYIVVGERVLRYDNERDKGDHRHVGTVAPYVFATPDQLMADFHADIVRWNHENGRA